MAKLILGTTDVCLNCADKITLNGGYGFYFSMEDGTRLTPGQHVALEEKVAAECPYPDTTGLTYNEANRIRNEYYSSKADLERSLYGELRQNWYHYERIQDMRTYRWECADHFQDNLSGKKYALPKNYCWVGLNSGGYCGVKAKEWVNGVGYCGRHIGDAIRRADSHRINTLRQEIDAWAKEVGETQLWRLHNEFGLTTARSASYSNYKTVQMDLSELIHLLDGHFEVVTVDDPQSDQADEEG